ncbi:MAG: MBL fold metallo-hydrolase [Chloroflexi bacterium]|nr:MBL fold metallo-hydrolase [Chloroflexota bacterium]HEV8053963.1 MBL fold metallo-hydrolase [Candidatus Limnocylindrales bacterium]
MKLLSRAVGPIATNVYVVGDEASHEAIAIDTATPCVAWLTQQLASFGWTLKLIVSSHRHWDHIGDNAAVMEATGADLAAHTLDRYGLEAPQPLFAPFPIVPSVPAVDLAEGGIVRFGEIRLSVLHTPGHTEGSVCLLAGDEGLLLSGDTLFAGGWGRVDLPGGSVEAMIESIDRLASLEDHLRVLPGHGPETTIGRERAWMSMVARERRLPS